jgi:hypothetical protein
MVVVIVLQPLCKSSLIRPSATFSRWKKRAEAKPICLLPLFAREKVPDRADEGECARAPGSQSPRTGCALAQAGFGQFLVHFGGHGIQTFIDRDFLGHHLLQVL